VQGDGTLRRIVEVRPQSAARVATVGQTVDDGDVAHDVHRQACRRKEDVAFQVGQVRDERAI
jgi:hypothetical protein